MNVTNKPLQTGGSLWMWRNPDNTYRHQFLKLDLTCEPGDYAGILIISDAIQGNALAFNIERLIKELPTLIEGSKEKFELYWWREDDAKKRNSMLFDLTERPVFIG